MFLTEKNIPKVLKHIHLDEKLIPREKQLQQRAINYTWEKKSSEKNVYLMDKNAQNM